MRLIIFLLFFPSLLVAEVFDLECVPRSGNLTGETLKIIYTPSTKEVFQNGNPLSFSTNPVTKSTTRLINLSVDDYFIKFSYRYSADVEGLIPGATVWDSTHYREINRATGIMNIRATITENGKTSDMPGGGFSMKCSKRENEF